MASQRLKRLCCILVVLALGMQYAHAHGDKEQDTADKPLQTAHDASFQLSAAQRRVLANYPAWTTAQQPLHIYGNTWYVGPRGLGVYLITAPTGHVLIDGGVPGHAYLIENSIQALGFSLHDIDWILVSHAHYDHAGGIAKLAQDTGARVIASAADTPLLERGGLNDPQYGDQFPFPPVEVARTVTDGETLQLGQLELTAHLTPGHTKGNTTWTWFSCEDGRCMHMVDVASLSAPGYTLIDNPQYPDIIKDFRHSFQVVAQLPCDIPLALHPAAVDFWKRVAGRRQGIANALVAPDTCRAYAQASRAQFEARLAQLHSDRNATQRE